MVNSSRKNYLKHKLSRIITSHLVQREPNKEIYVVKSLFYLRLSHKYTFSSELRPAGNYLGQLTGMHITGWKTNDLKLLSCTKQLLKRFLPLCEQDAVTQYIAPYYFHISKSQSLRVRGMGADGKWLQDLCRFRAKMRLIQMDLRFPSYEIHLRN